MNTKINSEQKIFYAMALFGGFLGGYALLCRCDVLGAAQTANMASLVIAILGKNIAETLIRIGAMLIYAFAIVLTVLIRNFTKLDLRIVSICFSFIGIFILYFIPENIDAVLALYPIFFILAFQWNTFPGAKGYLSSCIFSTNNLRQTVASFTNYICTKEENSLDKARFFAGSLFFYHIGVATSFFCNILLKFHSIAFGIIPLIFVLFEIYIESNISVKYMFCKIKFAKNEE